MHFGRRRPPATRMPSFVPSAYDAWLSASGLAGSAVWLRRTSMTLWLSLSLSVYALVDGHGAFTQTMPFDAARKNVPSAFEPVAPSQPTFALSEPIQTPLNFFL